MAADAMLSPRKRAVIAACQGGGSVEANSVEPSRAEMAPVPKALRATLYMKGIPANRRQERLQSAIAGPSVWTALRSSEVNREDVLADVLERTGGAGGDPS